MTAELGHFALALALALALVQAVVPLVGAARRDARLMMVAAPAAIGQFALVGLSFACLTSLFLTSDFSVLTVVQNSHTEKPWIYKLAGVWGNHEGSMLLWVLILALLGAAIALFGRNLPATLQARVLSVQAMIGAAFLLFLVVASNPFLRVFPVPVDGEDLNPLLQDPALAFHPPFLYLGYVGFSIAFSFAVAALLEGKVDAAWARWVRPWTLLAWASLTIGIAMGSWWAYYELGWGGWWFWDPVENASLMPWLAGTALLHSAIVVEKRDTLKTWTIFLAILTFSLSLVGTFLVRSGVLTSVHAFALDPDRGMFILGILVVTIGGSFTLFAARAAAMTPTGVFAPVSRESALVANNLLLSAACATVFVGTLYPLALDALTGAKISVGAPFFNATFGPLMVPLLLLMPFGPMLAWKRGDSFTAARRLAGAIIIALIAVAVFYLAIGDATLLSALGLGLGVWVIAGAAADLAFRAKAFRAAPGETWRRLRHLGGSAYGSALAHAGLGVMVLGIVSMSVFQEEDVRHMAPGESAGIGGYTVRFDSVTPFKGPNYVGERASFRIVETGEELVPEKRIYPVRQMPTTEAAIRTDGISDLYVVLGDQLENAATPTWTVRLYHNPLAPWIWAGAVIMMLGGLVSLTDRRLRIGVARTSRRPAGAAAARAGAAE